MAVTKTHPIKSTLKKAIDYICNPAKTNGKHLVSSFGCSAEKSGTSYKTKLKAAIDRLIPIPRPSRQPKQADKQINLLIDIQNNIKVQENAGFAHWAKINNLKQAAKTMNFLTEHGIDSYEALEEKTAETATASDKLLASIKSTESRMADLALLMKHADTYRELKPVYDSYRKSSDKEKFLRGHESDIILFEASGRALKDMEIEKLPSAEKMKAEHDAPAADKDKLYSEYKTARQETREYGVIKQNVDSLLSVPKE